MSVQKNTPNFLKHSGLSFTTIINQTMDRIKDDGALGIYCYLASKPQDWEICQAHLANRFGKGREYIQNRIKMLKQAGLIKIEPVRDEKGKILCWETSLLNFVENQITENPYSSPELSTDSQNTALSTSRETKNLGKQALVIKDIKQIKDFKKIKDKSFCAAPLLEEPKEKQDQKRLSKARVIHDNGIKHEWAPMANEKASIERSEAFKRIMPPPELKLMINKIKMKSMVQ